jgi:hypothetical protein
MHPQVEQWWSNAGHQSDPTSSGWRAKPVVRPCENHDAPAAAAQEGGGWVFKDRQGCAGAPSRARREGTVVQMVPKHFPRKVVSAGSSTADHPADTEPV